jgi:hypothetical protein
MSVHLIRCREELTFEIDTTNIEPALSDIATTAFKGHVIKRAAKRIRTVQQRKVWLDKRRDGDIGPVLPLVCFLPSGPIAMCVIIFSGIGRSVKKVVKNTTTLPMATINICIRMDPLWTRMCRVDILREWPSWPI